MTRPRLLSVIIPTYNEALNIPHLLPEIHRSLSAAGFEYEVLIVDDVSPDKTADVAESIAKETNAPVRVLRRGSRQSLASAVVVGAKAAVSPCVAVMDADLSHDPASLATLATSVVSGEVDVAIGSRYVDGGMIGPWQTSRRLLSRFGTACARKLTSVRDPLSGFFVCKRDLLDGKAVALRPIGYKILLEILSRTDRLRIIELPIKFSNRVAGNSKLGFRQQIEFLLQLVFLGLNVLHRIVQKHLWHKEFVTRNRPITEIGLSQERRSL
jgi:dolichol-phosphate mannosyltransferase